MYACGLHVIRVEGEQVMQTKQDKRAVKRAIQRPALYKIEQYARKTGVKAAQLFREKGISYYKKMPGVKSVKAYQGRFGFGPHSHDIEIWIELQDMACLDRWEQYVISHQDEILAIEAEWDQYFEDRGSRLVGEWPDPRWAASDDA
jgi:hypothetical protein